MAKYVSNRQKNLRVGIGSYTENKTVLEVTGKVGIGTTDAQGYKLYVVGNIYSTGVITATSFNGNATSATYAPNAGVSTYAVNAGVATYAPNAGVSTYSPNAGVATYADVAGIATYAVNSGVATYAPNAGVSTYAVNAGVATYAPNAGVATYATSSGIATYAPNAGVSTYAVNAGVSTYAVNAGVATYAVNSGVATYAPNAGVSTYAVNAGVATYAPNSGISTSVIGGISSVSQLRVSGVSTLGIVTAGNIFSTGVITATSYFGSGGNLEDIIATKIDGLTVKEEGVSVGSSYRIIDFIGSELTATGVGSTAFVTLTIPGSANQVLYKNLSNNLVGSNNLTFDGDLLYTNNLTVNQNVDINGNLNIDGTITIGGTAAQINVKQFTVEDPNIVVGLGTTFSPTDVTASRGGIALASNDGSPLVNLQGIGGDTLPSTYKRIIWFRGGDIGAGITDAWLLNYAVGIGSTRVPNGVRLAAGGMQVTDTNISSPNLNISGISTINSLDVNKISPDGSDFGAANYVPVANGSGGWSWAAVTAAGAVSGISIRDEGTAKGDVTTLNFVGAGVTATVSGGIGTVTIDINSIVSTVTYVENAGIATYATNAGVSTYAVSAGIATYTTSSGIATYATNAGIATYATNAGVSTYAVSAGIATYATSSGIATYATNAGVSTYATSSGIATYATSSGIATYATNAGVSTYATSSGIATYATNAGVSTYATSSGIATYATNAGVSTYATNAGFSTSSGLSTSVAGGIASVTQLRVTGVSTLGIVTAGNIFSTGVITATNFVGDGSQLTNVVASGVAITIASNTLNQNQFLTYAVGVGSTAGLGVTTTGLVFNPSTTRLGIGTTNPTSNLHVVGSGLFTGIVTAISFSGNVTNASFASTSGIATYATNAGFSTSSGISTSVIGGISSVTQLRVTGISTLGIVTAGNIFSTGVITATNFVGDGSGLTNVTVSGVNISISTNTSNQNQLLTYAVGVGSTASLGVTTTGLVFNPATNSFGIGTDNPTSNLYVTGQTTIQDLNVTGIGTFSSSGLKLKTSDNAGEITFETSNGFNNTITIPSLSDNNTLNLSKTSNTWTNSNTFNGSFTVSSNTTIIQGSDSVPSSTITLGRSTQTGTITLGNATVSQTTDIQAGASGVGTTKTINFGTGGLSGSNTRINVGPTAGVGTVSINSGTNLGIGTPSPTSKLHVVGDGLFTGIVTANSFKGDGSQLTGVVASGVAITISSNTLNQNQFLTYAVGVGSTAGLGVTTTGLVFNPSTTRLGIGTTNPTSNLHVVGDGLFTGVVTAISFSGNATSASYASTAGVSTSVIGGISSVSQLRVTGVSTLGIVTAGNIFSTGIITATNFVGDGSQLTNVVASGVAITIASNTLNQNQFLTYAVGVGSTAGLGVTTTGLVFNPSTTRLGIGTTNPTSNLHVVGSGFYTGIVTALSFSGNATSASYASTAGIATYATSSGIATYATNAGTSTSVIGGISSVTQLRVTGISTLGIVTAGNIFSTGIITATNFVGDGSQLTNLATPGVAITISSNVINQAQFLTYAVGVGTTAGLGVTTTGLVFNPSTTRLGIGTTNPTSNLHVVGSGLFTGIVTANQFSGDGSLLTGVSGGVSISTNTTNQAQYITYTPGAGTTTGLGITASGLVFNPSSGNLGIGTTNPSQRLHVQGSARITGAIHDSTNSPGTSGQVLISSVSGTQWGSAPADPAAGKFNTNIDSSLYVQPTGTLDIVGVGTTTTQITTLPAGSSKYIVRSIHVTNISNGDAEITSGFIMNQRKVPASISVSVGSSGGAGIHTISVGSASSIRVGMAVTGTGNIGETTGPGATAGFQFNTYVTSVDGNVLTFDKPMTGNATGTAFFSPVSILSSRLPVPVGSAVELLKEPMILDALDSIVVQSTGNGSGIGSTSTAAISQTANSNFLTVTAGAAITNFITSGMLIQSTENNTGIQTNTFVGVGYTAGSLTIPMTKPATTSVANTSYSFTEVVVPQDGALQTTIVYQSISDSSYQNGTGIVAGLVASNPTPGITTTVPTVYYGTGNTYPAVVQSIKVVNISDEYIYPGGDYPVWVGIGNSDTVFSWLAYNMMVPKNSSIELCESPKRLGIGQSIFAYAYAPNTIEIQISARQKTT